MILDWLIVIIGLLAALVVGDLIRLAAMKGLPRPRRPMARRKRPAYFD